MTGNAIANSSANQENGLRQSLPEAIFCFLGFGQDSLNLGPTLVN
jgi:hypothetical protein